MLSRSWTRTRRTTDNTPEDLGWLAPFWGLFTAVLNEKPLATRGSEYALTAKKSVAEAASAIGRSMAKKAKGPPAN